MPLFRYKAINAQGETLQGEMEAASEQEVIAHLQQAGHMPIEASPAGSGFSLERLLQHKNRPKSADLLRFTQQLSNLINAGMPLDRSLQVLEELAEEEPMRRLIHDLREEVREGSSLADAMQARHGVFNRLYINMVRAGELSGALDKTLTRLAEYQERAHALKQNVTSALIYPTLLLLMAIGSVVLLLVFVVPQFAPLFDEMGGELPGITRMVLAVAGFVQHWWWVMLPAVVALWFWGKAQMENPQTRRKWDAFFLQMPLLGDLLARLEMARLARTLSTLLENGVAMLTALSIGRKVLGNTVMADDVAEAAEAVKKGGMLAPSLSKNGHFPRLALQMIQVGEETGKLESMLDKVANTYDDEVQLAVERMLSILVPVLIIGLAVLIGVIVMSIILAIISVNDIVV